MTQVMEVPECAAVAEPVYPPGAGVPGELQPTAATSTATPHATSAVFRIGMVRKNNITDPTSLSTLLVPIVTIGGGPAT